MLDSRNAAVILLSAIYIRSVDLVHMLDSRSAASLAAGAGTCADTVGAVLPQLGQASSRLNDWQDRKSKVVTLHVPIVKVLVLSKISFSWRLCCLH
jgi:hypothetical protein